MVVRTPPGISSTVRVNLGVSVEHVDGEAHVGLTGTHHVAVGKADVRDG